MKGPMITTEQFDALRLSVAMTASLDGELRAHLDKGPRQEDLAFALWRPCHGHARLTAVLCEIILPEPGDRILQGNVAFTADYAQRVLDRAGEGCGVALLHSHLGPGWQGMSDDDIVAERDRLAAAVAGRTGLPLLGLTWGTDGAWSGRFWIRQAPGRYERRWAGAVRVVGQALRITYHPGLFPARPPTDSQIATASVWGDAKQADLSRVHAGIVGLGSVGSIVAEALSRVGVSRLSLIDHDHIEVRNLDRTLGAIPADAEAAMPKVRVSERLVQATHTAQRFEVEAYHGSLLSPDGVARALDCDVIFSCVDRPWPRHVLNAMSYAHLIPVIDGGILAKVEAGHLLHADWRMHTVGPDRPCLVCLGALRREDIALDMAGLLDDPEYIKGLDPAFKSLLARQNVFPFSMSVAAHEVLQFLGLVTGQPRIGGVGAQVYHCYPGRMEVTPDGSCSPGCEYTGLIASAADLCGDCVSPPAPH